MKLSLALASLLVSIERSSAVLYGDEQFGELDGGRFWVFNSNGVAIVNPDTCRVEHTVSNDSEGNLLPGRWYDGVYMESCSETEEEINGQECNRYVVMNSAVTVTDTHGEDAGSGEVIFFDTKTRSVASRVLVGPQPVHSYAVYTEKQYWTHADGDGFFYVIDLGDIDKHTGKPIKAKIDEANHGKLLWDESDLLQNTGYATSVGEPHLFIIDMKTQAQIGTFDFSDQAGCFGSHSIAYARANQHVYIECTGPGGLLEIDVSNPRDPALVKQHAGITGSLYETPDELYLSVTDKGGDKFHLLKPGATGTESSVDHSIDVSGHPQGPVWYPSPKDGQGNIMTALDYKICLSLTVNTNKNHHNSDGELVCDFYGCSQAITAADVESGICLYEADETGAESRNLLQANITQIEDVKMGKAPFGEACKRCNNENNFDEVDGLCTCTPTCGSCAANSKEDHDGDLSGAVCLDMNKLLEHKERSLAHSDVEVSFVAAGSVKQGSPYAGSPECGFGRTYRPHKRGGIYDAMPTDYPEPSLSLIDMRDFSLKCAVELPGSPYRVVYVPPGETETESSSSLSAGAIAGIAIGGLVGLVLMVALINIVANNKKGPDHQVSTKAANEEQDMEAEAGQLM